ncbi:MAG: sulfotransferase [Xanthomonadales bacterium]|nr:sulfotransferase [Xanthomonadales bacterium]
MQAFYWDCPRQDDVEHGWWNRVRDAVPSLADAGWLAANPEPQPGPGPVFIVGLPRTGTTLVDRILSSFDAVASLGEINTMAFAVIRNAGPSRGKLELLERSAAADTHRIGQHYLEGTRGYGLDARWLIDKTPLNYLYIGLIRRALPTAKIIHLRRHPLDSCYAMYKTLFRVGYPFSYSLQDVGRYYMAYRRLMDHWRSSLPGRILDVDYERLVTDQEAETRRILAHCNLEFEQSCLDFHRQKGPAATASAAQVRKPIYSSSVGRWKCYDRQLAPLAGKLKEHGIEID